MGHSNDHEGFPERGIPDFWTAQTVAHETERTLSYIPDGLPPEEHERLKKFAILTGEKLADEMLFEFELSQEAAKLGDLCFSQADACRDRIISMSPSHSVGVERARVSSQFIGLLAEQYTDSLLWNRDYTQPRTEKQRQIRAVSYLGQGFHDALLSQEDFSEAADTDFPEDGWEFPNYYKGMFIAGATIGDASSISIMEVVYERQTTYRAPDYHPSKADLDILFGGVDRYPQFLSDAGSLVPFVSWAATVELKAGLKTPTKQNFDTEMARYGYRWIDAQDTYRWKF